MSKVLKKQKRKALYLRKSREDKESDDTLKTHRKVLLDFCNNKGWTIEPTDIYEEIISGDSDDKTELHRLIDNLEQYDGVICMDIDRLSRNDVEANQLKQLFYINDIEVITPNKTYDFENDSDDLLYSFESLIAKAELKQIKKRLKQGKINKFKQGLYTTGKPPIGYVRDPQTKKLIINEQEAEIVRFIFQMSVSGYGARIISDNLSERGYRTRTGKSFPVPHIRAIQRNKTYIGTTTLKVKNKRGEVTEMIENDDSCPPIISLEMFIKANEELDRRNLNKNNTRGYVKSCLSGLIKCKTCNNRMKISINRDGSRILRNCETIQNGTRCGNNGVKLDVIENEVILSLTAYENVLREQLKSLQGNTSNDMKERLNNDLRAFEDRLKEIDKEDDRLDDLAIDGLIKKDKLKARKDALEKETKDVQLKVKDIKIKLADLNNQNNIDHLEFLISMITKFKDHDIQTQNTFLKGIIDDIVYVRDAPRDAKGRKAKDFLDRYPPKIHINYRQ